MLRNIWNRWVVLARKIGNFQSRVLLTLFYFVIVAPFGLVMSLLGDPLRRRKPPADSGWSIREQHESDLKAAKRQF